MNADAANPKASTAVSGARASLALLLAINMFNYIDRYVLAAVAGPLKADLFGEAGTDGADPLADTKFGTLTMAFLIAYMVLSPLFGWLGDRFNRWVVIGVGVLLWSAASGGSGLAMTFSTLLLMRIMVGVGEAAYGPVAPTLIADLYPVSRRGAVLAWFYAAIPVGSALGYVLGGQMLKFASWHWAFFVTVPPGILLGLWCFFKREVPRGLSDAAAPVRKLAWRDYLVFARTPSFVYNTLGMTAMTFAIGGISVWAPVFLIEHRMAPAADPEAQKALAAAVNFNFGAITAAAGLLATLSGGWLADKLRARYSGSYFLVSGVAMLIGFPMLLGVLYAPFPLAWVFLFLAVFFLFFNTGPSNTIVANVTHPAMRATAYAVTIFIIHVLGDAISPVIIGAITDATKTDANPKGNMTMAFMLVGIVIVLGGVLWLMGARHLKRDTELAVTRV